MEEKKKMRPRGGNSPVIGDNGLVALPGDNAKYAGLLSTILSWPKVDKNDIPGLEQRLVEYVNFCAENDVKIGNQVC
jgi:hypothetical protein